VRTETVPKLCGALPSESTMRLTRLPCSLAGGAPGGSRALVNSSFRASRGWLFIAWVRTSLRSAVSSTARNAFPEDGFIARGGAGPIDDGFHGLDHGIYKDISRKSPLKTAACNEFVGHSAVCTPIESRYPG
jgi:hypothetical protein